MKMPLSAPLLRKRKSSRSSKSLYTLSERSQPPPLFRKITPSFGLTENRPLFMTCQPLRSLPLNREVKPFSRAGLSSFLSPAPATAARRHRPPTANRLVMVSLLGKTRDGGIVRVKRRRSGGGG